MSDDKTTQAETTNTEEPTESKGGLDPRKDTKAEGSEAEAPKKEEGVDYLADSKFYNDLLEKLPDDQKFASTAKYNNFGEFIKGFKNLEVLAGKKGVEPVSAEKLTTLGEGMDPKTLVAFRDQNFSEKQVEVTTQAVKEAVSALQQKYNAETSSRHKAAYEENFKAAKTSLGEKFDQTTGLIRDLLEGAGIDKEAYSSDEMQAKLLDPVILNVLTHAAKNVRSEAFRPFGTSPGRQQFEQEKGQNDLMTEQFNAIVSGDHKKAEELGKQMRDSEKRA